MRPKYAKDIFMVSVEDNSRSRHNHIVDFMSSSTNIDLRSKQKDMILATPRLDNNMIIIEKDSHSVHNIDKINTISYYYYIENQDYVTMMLASLFIGLFNKSRANKKKADILVSTTKFLLWEYQNPISALHLIYDAIYSRNHLTDVSLAQMISIQILTNLSKKALDPETGWSNMQHLEYANFSSILDFRNRVYQLRATIRDLTIDKIDLYSILSQRKVDFKRMIELAPKLKKKLDQTQEEIDALLDYRGENINLTREALIFEICVLERSFISHRLRSKYKAAIEDTKHRIGSIDPLHLRTRDFSFLNASNIVIFTDYAEHSQRIRRFTHNTAHLLDVRREELLGTPITEFMPAKIAKSHGRFVLNFVNGESRSRRRGVINTVVISRKKAARSVMILVKLEYLFFDDVHLAALVSVRKKNSHPMVYTDLSGNIIGASRKAQEKLGIRNEQESIALFTMFPRLFPIFFPSYSSQYEVNFEQSTFTQHLGYVPEIQSKNIELDYNISKEDKLSTQLTLDAYFFQMLSTFSTDSNPKLNYVEQSVILTTTQTLLEPHHHEEEDHWKHVKNSLQRTPFETNAFDQMVKSLNSQKKTILENLSKVYKTRVAIETNHYQRHISLREISLSSLSKVPSKLKSFIKLFARYNETRLVDILTISPDSLSAICTLSEHLNLPYSKDDSPEANNQLNRSNKDIIIRSSHSIGNNNVANVPSITPQQKAGSAKSAEEIDENSDLALKKVTTLNNSSQRKIPTSQAPNPLNDPKNHLYNKTSLISPKTSTKSTTKDPHKVKIKDSLFKIPHKG
jgi:hypothetical protein